jgi:hypothetical protein
VIDNPFADELSTMTAAWSDQWFDETTALLWNPPGSFGGVIADRSVHLVPQSAWYGVALLRRDGPGDRERAVRVIDALLALQYDRPGVVWHGTFARFLEWPEPSADAVEWDDYDPNWRQFLGTTWLVVLREFEAHLPAATVNALERSLRLCVEGEPTGRVAAWYTNIALMKAVLEVEAGHRLQEPAWVDRGHELASAVFERRRRKGAFDEFNSPTYYGIDLLGLALWRTCDVSSRLNEWGSSMERALWAETSLLYHAGLGNLCGPYTRSYGMDLHRYVAAISLWIWPLLGRAATPMPDLDDASIDHGHDFCLGSMVAILGSDVPVDARNWIERFPGESLVERSVGDRPRRTITAWLADRVMIGGEDNDEGWPAWHQYYPATVHWQAVSDIGSVRLVHNGPVRARAGVGELVVECGPAPDGSQPTFLVEVDGFDRAAVSPTRWSLPGLDVEVVTDLDLDEVIPFGATHLLAYTAPATPTTFRLQVRPTS